jgi:polar amino acid transport system substrate-binding protein
MTSTRCLPSIVCLLLALHGMAGEKIRLATGEWPPYAGEALPHGGFAERIISAAFLEAGIDVDYQYLSWKRGYEMARQGKIDGAILWNKNHDVSQEFLSTEAVVTSSVVLFFRQSKPLGPTLPQSLSGYRLAFPNGYGYEEIPAFNHLIVTNGSAPLVVDTDRQAMQALINDRIDVFPADRLVGLYLLRELMPDYWHRRVGLVQEPILVEGLGVLISNKMPRARAWVTRFNAGLSQLRNKGLLTKWTLEAEQAVEPPSQ